MSWKEAIRIFSWLAHWCKRELTRGEVNGLATYLIDYENVNKDGLNGVSRLTEKDRVIIFYSARADRMTFGLHRRLNETKALVEYRRVDVGGHNALDFQLATWLGFLIAQDSDEEYCIVSNDKGFEFLAGFWRRPMYNVTRTREIAESPQAEERRHQRQQDRTEMTADSGTDPVQAEVDFQETGLPDKEPEEDRTPEYEAALAEEEHTELIVLKQESRELVKVEQPDIDPEAKQQEKRDPQEAKPSKEQSKDKENHEEKPRSGAEPYLAALDLTAEEKEEIASYIGRYKTKLGINNALVRKFGTQKAGEIYKAIKPLIRNKKGSSEKTAATEEMKLAEDVKKLVAGVELTDEDLREIASCVQRCKTRQGVNNALVRRFRSQKAGEIYKMIKPLLKDKKGRNN